MPEDSIVAMLKTLPEDILIDIFWKTMVESDTSPLTDEEKEEMERGKKEFERGETIKLRSQRVNEFRSLGVCEFVS